MTVLEYLERLGAHETSTTVACSNLREMKSTISLAVERPLLYLVKVVTKHAAVCVFFQVNMLLL